MAEKGTYSDPRCYACMPADEAPHRTSTEAKKAFAEVALNGPRPYRTSGREPEIDNAVPITATVSGHDLADWLTNYATCVVDDERVSRRLMEIVGRLRAEITVAEWVGLIEDLLPRDGVIDDSCSLANEIAYMIVEKLGGTDGTSV